MAIRATSSDRKVEQGAVRKVRDAVERPDLSPSHHLADVCFAAAHDCALHAAHGTALHQKPRAPRIGEPAQRGERIGSQWRGRCKAPGSDRAVHAGSSRSCRRRRAQARRETRPSPLRRSHRRLDRRAAPAQAGAARGARARPGAARPGRPPSPPARAAPVPGCVRWQRSPAAAGAARAAEPSAASPPSPLIVTQLPIRPPCERSPMAPKFESICAS